MGSRMRLVIAAAAVAALAGCAGSQLGSGVDDGTFGNATMNNTLVQTGQQGYVEQLSGRFASEVPTTVNFAFNSAMLDEGARAILRQQAGWIRQFPEVRFRVYGHTDLVGSESYNKQLGLRRAQAVVAYLGTLGVSRSRLEAMVSRGESEPQIPTPHEERLNRRAVTEVNGFVAQHPMVLNGKYAQVIHREYVQSATTRHPQNQVVATQVGGDE